MLLRPRSHTAAPSIQGADTVLVSSGRTLLSPTVYFFVKTASREVLCVLAMRGHLTTIVPLPTVRAMLVHSAAETFKGFVNATLSLARKIPRAGRLCHSSDDETCDTDDSDETTEDGMHVVDLALTSCFSVVPTGRRGGAR